MVENLKRRLSFDEDPKEAKRLLEDLVSGVEFPKDDIVSKLLEVEDPSYLLIDTNEGSPYENKALVLTKEGLFRAHNLTYPGKEGSIIIPDLRTMKPAPIEDYKKYGEKIIDTFFQILIK